jgi:hypothetical protein
MLGVPKVEKHYLEGTAVECPSRYKTAREWLNS